jgi:hypothetical protein
VWLLKQKQTQGWSRSQATTSAVFALLLGAGKGATSVQSLKGGDRNEIVVSMGGHVVQPGAAEAGQSACRVCAMADVRECAASGHMVLPGAVEAVGQSVSDCVRGTSYLWKTQRCVCVCVCVWLVCPCVFSVAVNVKVSVAHSDRILSQSNQPITSHASAHPLTHSPHIPLPTHSPTRLTSICPPTHTLTSHAPTNSTTQHATKALVFLSGGGWALR